MFGLFKKKEVKPEIDLVSMRQKELQAQVFDKYPVGREFDYMGVKLRVTEHVYYVERCDVGRLPMPSIKPKIKCDYINKNGQIEQVLFRCSEVKTWGT